MSIAIKRMLHERRVLANRALLEKELARRAEVKAAFLEGLLAGVDFMDPDEAWQFSRARGNLYVGPPTPIHLAAKLKAAGHKFCDCRRPGGPERA